MFYFQQILMRFSTPLTLVILLLILGCFYKKRKYIVFSVLILIVCSLPITSFWLFNILESNSCDSFKKDSDSSQAIIVLGGYLSTVSNNGVQNFQWGGADRFFTGIAYAKRHSNQLLVFTNEQLPWMNSGTGQFLYEWASRFGIPNTKIIITGAVQNTQDEAFESKKNLSPMGISEITLVTSAFHMKRAMDMFSKADFIVHPLCSDFRAKSFEKTILNYLPSASAFSASDNALREFLLRAYYKF